MHPRRTPESSESIQHSRPESSESWIKSLLKAPFRLVWSVLHTAWDVTEGVTKPIPVVGELIWGGRRLLAGSDSEDAQPSALDELRSGLFGHRMSVFSPEERKSLDLAGARLRQNIANENTDVPRKNFLDWQVKKDQAEQGEQEASASPEVTQEWDNLLAKLKNIQYREPTEEEIEKWSDPEERKKLFDSAEQWEELNAFLWKLNQKVFHMTDELENSTIFQQYKAYEIQWVAQMIRSMQSLTGVYTRLPPNQQASIGPQLMLEFRKKVFEFLKKGANSRMLFLRANNAKAWEFLQKHAKIPATFYQIHEIPEKFLSELETETNGFIDKSDTNGFFDYFNTKYGAFKKVLWS